MEDAPGSRELNAVILGSARRESAADLAEIAGSGWSLARLSG